MGAAVFEVFVPRTKWPTFAAFNAALAKRGYPMRVLPGEGKTENDRLAENARWMLEARVILNGEEHVSHLEEMSTRSVLDDVEETNERLEECGSPFRITDEYDVLMTTFGRRIDPKYLVPGVLMNVVMINDFDGYGFDGEEMKFGRQEYADEMLSWIASDIKSQNDLPPAGDVAASAQVPHSPQTDLPTPAPSLATMEEHKPKSRWTFWRIALALFLLALAAEFIDKNIYNFTGTGT